MFILKFHPQQFYFHHNKYLYRKLTKTTDRHIGHFIGFCPGDRRFDLRFALIGYTDVCLSLDVYFCAVHVSGLITVT